MTALLEYLNLLSLLNLVHRKKLPACESENYSESKFQLLGSAALSVKTCNDKHLAQHR